MKRILFLTFILANCFSAQAQFSEWIASGRPGQSIGGYSVGKSVFQIQAGATFNNYFTDIPALNSPGDDWLQNTVIRYGITEKLEVSGVLGNQLGATKNGINNTQLGFRYNFLHDQGGKPALAFQARALLPVGSSGLKRKAYGTRFLLSAANSLTDNFSIGTNLGLTFGSEESPSKSYTVYLDYSLSDHWHAFIESYDSFFDFDHIRPDYDGGVGYFITKDFKLDASAGWQDTPDSRFKNWFIDFGFSLRFHGRDG